MVIDTLRADHLSCYGYHRKTSPNIDKFASQGVLFSNAYPTDVPTQPCYTAMFTSQRGISTGVVSHSPTETLSDEIPYLPEILAGKGYTTGGVSTLYHKKKYFARGFQWYMNPVAGTRLRTQQVDADEINSAAIPWIKQNYEKDFFLFIHYWDPHGLYFPPEPYRDLYYKGDKSDPNNHSLDPLKQQVLWAVWRYFIDVLGGDITDIEYIVAQYDGEITYVDEKFGELLHTLEAMGITDETMVILTSDHGESLGEHNIYFDHSAVYEPTIHVPLIFKFPQKFPKGRKTDALVQLIDLAPTIFNILELPTPEQFEGRNLLPILYGETEEGYREIYTNQGLWSAKRMIRTGKWKLIKTIDPGFWDTPPKELYNLEEDPGETCNLVEKEKELTDQLDLRMQRWLEAKLKRRLDPLRVIANLGLPTVRRMAERVKEKAEAGSSQAAWQEWRSKLNGY